jgi:hypothetical protein
MTQETRTDRVAQRERDARVGLDRDRLTATSRRSAWLGALVLGVGLVLESSGRLEAAEPAHWELLRPADESYVRLFTPASGALFALAQDRLVPLGDGTQMRFYGDLLRSDDGGLTWTALAPPPSMQILTVSPRDQQVLYAGGWERLFRSEDGGATWQLVAERPGETWARVEVSPVAPSVVYAFTLASPPANYGTNSWHLFLVSHDSGASWEEQRTHHETFLPGTQPCAYAVRSMQPHGYDPQRVLTIEGCTGRGMAPVGGQSLNEGFDVTYFPGTMPAVAIVGGRGAQPGRWYASLLFAGSLYGGSDRSKLVRSDDDGATWATLLESDTGGTTPETARTADLVGTLAYNPERPDELYLVNRHREPAGSSSSSIDHFTTIVTVRATRDGGASWVDLGAPSRGRAELPTIFNLAVGIDGRYLFAATDQGLYRLALTDRGGRES